MKALILAAGYATRLRPLTDSWAKELLPVGGRPIIDLIVDNLADVAEVACRAQGTHLPCLRIEPRHEVDRTDET